MFARLAVVILFSVGAVVFGGCAWRRGRARGTRIVGAVAAACALLLCALALAELLRALAGTVGPAVAGRPVIG